jgi:hypothetical protein
MSGVKHSFRSGLLIVAHQDQPRLRESDLETAVIEHLQPFLLELGKGFAFVVQRSLPEPEYSWTMRAPNLSQNLIKHNPSGI